MFELNQAFAEWRRQMATGGVNLPEILDELESHLREEVEKQTRAGMDLREAFDAAVQQIGRADALKTEFAKTAPISQTRLRGLKNAILSLLGIHSPEAVFYTEDAERSLRLAPEAARHFGHTFVGTEHLLLGLLDQNGPVVPAVLQSFGVNCDTVRSEIEKVVGVEPEDTPAGSIPLTPRARRALRLASREAATLKRNRVGAEHVLLGLLQEGSGVAALVLQRLGVDAAKVRAEILRRTLPEV